MKRRNRNEGKEMKEICKRRNGKEGTEKKESKRRKVYKGK